jgi:hypothetical protein
VHLGDALVYRGGGGGWGTLTSLFFIMRGRDEFEEGER